MLLEVTSIVLFRSPRRGRTAKSDQSSGDANQHDPGYRAGMAPPDQAHVGQGSGGTFDPARLRRVVLVVAGLNLVNLSIIAMAVVTLWSRSGWPDLVLGCFIILLALRAAREVWEVSEEERLAARALAGEQID